MSEDLEVEFRAQRSLLQALHDTQQEHTARLETMDGRLGKVEGRLDRVEGTLQKVHVGVELIHEKLDRLIDAE